MVRKIQYLILSSIAITVITTVTLLAINHLLLQKKMDKVIFEDSRNRGLLVKVTYEKYYKFNSLIVNYKAVAAPASPLSVLRNFLQYSRTMVGKKYDKVLIAYRSTPRMMIDGEAFADLGERYGNEKTVKMLVHLATNLRHLNGDKILSIKSGNYATLLNGLNNTAFDTEKSPEITGILSSFAGTN